MGLQEQIGDAQKSVINDRISMSVSEVVAMYQQGEITINPEFQRLFRWSRKQKSDLIESILVRIPIPPLFVYETEDIKWELVDGLQRLSTILEFLGELRKPDSDNLEPPSHLTGTKYLPALENMVWQRSPSVEGLTEGQQVEIDKSMALAIRRARLDFQILKQPSDSSTKYDLFRRLNRGGVYATQQEVRSCLMVMLNAPLFAEIKAAAQHPSFVELTKFSEQRTAEQTDIEHTLRYLVHVSYDYDDKSDVQDFIDATAEEFMTAANTDATLTNFKETFDLILNSAGSGGLRAPGGRYSLRSLEAVAVGIGRNLAAIQSLAAPEAYVAERITDFWAQPDVEAMSAGGLRGTQRLQRTIPFGANWFNPNAPLAL